MPGHLGVVQRTIQNLQVIDIDLENNLILLRGAVPGHREGLLEIKPSVKGKADKPVVAPVEEVEDKKKGPARRK
jgi:large subunit ribosomal protein L3